MSLEPCVSVTFVMQEDEKKTKRVCVKLRPLTQMYVRACGCVGAARKGVMRRQVGR